LPEDVAKREANNADNERWQARKQRRRPRCAARTAVRVRREETPSESESSGDDDEEEDEDEEEREITSSLHSSPLEVLPSLGDLFYQ
jgi:hypothetical protein